MEYQILKPGDSEYPEKLIRRMTMGKRLKQMHLL